MNIEGETSKYTSSSDKNTAWLSKPKQEAYIWCARGLDVATKDS